MKNAPKITWATVAYASIWLAAAACGQSENIGWAGRDMPDSMVARGAATESLAREQAFEAEASVLSQEYQQLSSSLQQVIMRALAEPDLESAWNAMVSDADAAIFGRSAFHRGLLARRQEIERSMQRPDTLSAERQAELMRNYRNIQLEMARIRNEEFRKPEFADRYLQFQRELFARMKRLAPERRAEIDRLLELEEQAFVPRDTTPPVPGMKPIH